LYALFGVLTTIANAGTFLVCSHIFDEDHYILSNILAWFAGVLVAFITNKLWVFNSKSWKFKVIGKEIFEFLAARILSFVFENVGLDFCVRHFSLEGDKWRQLAVKLVLSVVVVTTNYVFSKFIIFRKKKTQK
jgi:putative flippase GtrA